MLLVAAFGAAQLVIAHSISSNDFLCMLRVFGDGPWVLQGTTTVRETAPEGRVLGGGASINM